MGIHNCASTLQDALDSLYSQTFKDFEIVLCDDGSTDGTLAVAEANASIHPCIKLLVNERNLGLNKTLNKCLGHASGEYVARMDGDDISLPDRFAVESSFLDHHPEYAIVSTPMIYFDENGEFGRGTGGFEPGIKSLETGSPFCHATCMVRKEAYDSVGGYTESDRLLRYEDYDLWAKMFAKGYRGYVLKECFYSMRDDRNAFSRRGLKVRLHGVYAHYLAHRSLGLSWIAFLKYSFRVMCAGAVPMPLYRIVHRRNVAKKI